jgi:hypothetical protein
LHGGRILFRFTAIDGGHNCLVTMRELENFVEVSEDVVQKLLEEYKKKKQKENKEDKEKEDGTEPPQT